MAREIERGATYLDKMCHKLYDEPKGHGFQVYGECRHCGGHLMTYYCEDRLYLIACEKCGALALTKSAAPQVAANLTLRKPTLTPPNEWVSVEDAAPDPGERVLATDGIFVGEAYRSSANSWFRNTGFPWRDGVTGRTVRFWMPMPSSPDRRPPEGEVDGK